MSLSLWKDITLFIHCSPEAGESGWMYIRLGISGSALPDTIHRELWNLYLEGVVFVVFVVFVVVVVVVIVVVVVRIVVFCFFVVCCYC